jgi:hypothetical protein
MDAPPGMAIADCRGAGEGVVPEVTAVGKRLDGPEPLALGRGGGHCSLLKRSLSFGCNSAVAHRLARSVKAPRKILPNSGGIGPIPLLSDL